MQRDVMTYDVLIVGAGPAGLAAAIRIKQLAAAQNREIGVCILEKGAEVGAHILSGAVIDPIALDELIPDWQAQSAPLKTAVAEDRFLVLDEDGAYRIPNLLLPPLMNNHGNYVVSLSNVCRWLADQAEALGVEIYPGFTAAEVLYDDNGAVRGVITGDMGVAKDGKEKADYAPGMALQASYTLIGEGVRGSLAKALEARFNLRDGVQPQKYGIGFKEVWQIDPKQHQPGLVMHTQGWPLGSDTGGGGFLYHLEENLVSVGFVVHLNYSNPYLSPFDEFQRYKTHPAIRKMLQGGKRLAYGARAINEGGLQSLPKLVFPGGALIGCSAGFVNVPRIKGSHNAMKSGMLAAEAVVEALAAGRVADELAAYPQALRASWVWKDLDKVRNVKPALSKFGNVAGSIYGGVEMWLGSLGVRLPWTLRHGKADHACLKPAAQSTPIKYPKYDGKISFDKLSSVFLSNVAHEENQPCHLKLTDAAVPITLNLADYDAPEQRYCPAGVYEIVRDGAGPRLQINAANCIHCKTCDIKDPSQNITWVTPEGGGGPNYQET
ncbi:Electron transfer flavoprotein-ubiquinone oxidoreductase [Andreprevotia sp. IGB-42]|uniref:electron transfer flavoprotein-ubiquinone oxidoreductase n=1 Tax=Andreprevotia sp. IGB-42 TaxID=2497473 RepID=UPI001358C2B2|nr:electron transfer flavoprotein-ubiquinone oxidoreductase [Andreprevotia sp. IGB-42]KAF0813092.1 Electron transfer flavoprotein-ubiquinone oxidoreductase [Andreprevotia sp. IGB-42]